MATSIKGGRDPILVRTEPVMLDEDSDDAVTEEMDESKDPLEESGDTVSGEEEEEEEEEIDEQVLEDMEKFEGSFRNISKRYRFINRIGEGTFSTVYKAEDILYEHYDNSWDLDSQETNGLGRPSRHVRKPRFVAIKKIYVTSSPLRILNELELLHDLRDSPNVCPLITAFRDQDQVIAILPFFQHKDFREYYREFSVSEMRTYFHALFTALKHVHEKRIIHRDIKPTNFLYSPAQKRGVLVDFGLAEREDTDYYACNCELNAADRQYKFTNSVHNTTQVAASRNGQSNVRPSYPTNDQRSSRRANRAGTRGFRAPEVLLKCTAQTVLIDIWSCGVILLTFLSKRFPFFHSADDIDAYIELCTIFGKKKMKECALLHGQVMQTNIPTIHESGYPWEKILLWCTGRNKDRHGNSKDDGLSPDELDAVEFMRGCLELDPNKRFTAEDCLRHPFLAERDEDMIL